MLIRRAGEEDHFIIDDDDDETFIIDDDDDVHMNKHLYIFICIMCGSSLVW
jgi:hypothetical protein